MDALRPLEWRRVRIYSSHKVMNAEFLKVVPEKLLEKLWAVGVL